MVSIRNFTLFAGLCAVSAARAGLPNLHRPHVATVDELSTRHAKGTGAKGFLTRDDGAIEGTDIKGAQLATADTGFASYSACLAVSSTSYLPDAHTRVHEATNLT